MGDRRTEHIPEKRRSALVIAPYRGGNDEIVQALRRERFQVTSVRTVYDGIAEFTHEPAKLVVLSLEGLSRGDRKALHIFQRRAPEVRVVLLVPEGRRGEVTAYLSAGADVFLPSPVYGRELQLVVRSLLRGDAADPLTGLPNKEAYERAFVREASRAKREDRCLALAICDLDGFGDINEKYDYLTADRVLAETAERLKSSLRVTDLVTRWGGDEFVALLTQLPKELDKAREEARGVLERARLRMLEPFAVDTKRIKVSLSGGVSFCNHEGSTREVLFAIANRRLRYAKNGVERKKRHGNRVVCGDEAEGAEPGGKG